MAKKAVVGILNNVTQADKVVVELERAGFLRSDISALFTDPSSAQDLGHEKHTKAPEGAATGVGAGGVIGGTLGLLAGIGALAIPGVGPFIAAGPIMAALSGAAAGAAAGGITGALVGLGIPEIEAKQYESKLRQGNVLLSVHVDDSEERKRAKEILEQNGARDVAAAGEKSVPTSSRRDASRSPRI